MATTIPAWMWVTVTLLSGGLIAYAARQIWSGYKLKKAIKAEIRSMNGLKNCRNSMRSRNSSPSSNPLSASDVPPAGSIPTTIYEANVGQLGLLRWKDLEKYVEFYSDVLRYKATITAIRSGEKVPEADQNDLYSSISDVEDNRQLLMEKNRHSSWLSFQGRGN